MIWKCCKCWNSFSMDIPWKMFDGKHYCDVCWNIGNPYLKKKTEVEMPTIPVIKVFNEPPHYHKHEIDTIEFLQKGFPPDVFKGFAIGSIIKYLHRHTEKGGLEDLLKAEDYAKRLYEFEKGNVKWESVKTAVKIEKNI